MKKLAYLLFLAIGVTACSVESMDSTENLLTADARYKVTVTESFNVPEEICAGVPAEFSFTAAVGSNLQVQQLISGVWTQVYQTSQSTANPQTFNLLFSEAGTYSLRYKIGAGGFTNAEPVIVSNCNDCEESFSYFDNGDGTYTFTYVPAENMNDALVVFTFAQGVDVSGLEGWDGNGVTRQLSLDFVACDEYSWTVELDTNCNGGGQKEANLWTDFKVGDESKKNDETPNITKNC